MGDFVIRVDGIDRAKLVPNELNERLGRFRHELVEPLVRSFIESEPVNTRWPKRRRKTIQEQTRGFVKGQFVVIGTFHSRYARALDEGAVVRPNRKQVIRFLNESGDFVFTRKPILHRARPFFGLVLARVPAVVSAVYEDVFRDVART